MYVLPFGWTYMKQIFFRTCFYRVQNFSSLNKSKYICVKSCFMHPIINNKKQILINHTRRKADLSLYLLPAKKIMKYCHKKML